MTLFNVLSIAYALPYKYMELILIVVRTLFLNGFSQFLCLSTLKVDGLNSLHSVKASPNRFTKTSQGRSWNTGNGSPDAICLTVDKPGVVLVGVCVYGGGGIHEYELEVLADDVSDKKNVV